MESSTAVAALSALAQENRLEAFRLLVQAGPQGIAAGEVSERLGIAPATLSFHLAQLRHAGLAKVRRQGRSLIYSADYEGMNQLVAFLMENCCAGAAVGCSVPVCEPQSATIVRRKSRGATRQ
jgi:DNA-binding transcriptional ArsR family regulator